MFSMCSELTPRAPIPNSRIAQFMQPWFIAGGQLLVNETFCFQGGHFIFTGIMFIEIPNSVPVKGQFPPFCVFSLRINSSSQVYRTPSPSQKKPIANSHISSFFFNLLCPPWIIPAFTFRVFFLVVILFPMNIYMAYLNESAQTKTA